MEAKINDNLRGLMVDVTTLVMDPRNVRQHDERNISAIKNSLATFGQVKPIVVKNGIVVAGNGTYEAARELGWTQIAAVEFDSDEPGMATAYAIADNKTTDLSSFDEIALPKLLDELSREVDSDVFAATGFDLEDLCVQDESVPSEDESITDQDQWLLVIDCESEEKLITLFEELKGRGMSCKIVT